MLIKVTKFITISCLSIILFQFSGCNNNTVSSGKEVVLRLEPSDGNPRNSEGDFLKLKDGKLLFIYTYFTEEEGDNGAAHLASRISSDGGNTWSSNDKIVVPNEGGMNIMSVSLIRLAEDKIGLIYSRKNSESDCSPILRTSEDEGETWSKPENCISDFPGYYVMNNDRIIKLKSGRIIFPLSLHKTPTTESTEMGIIVCYYSDDLGESWNRTNTIANPTKTVLQEPGMIELKDGKILLFCRTDVGVQYKSYSSDNGLTWSTIEPSNIKSPKSPASIRRIPNNGDLLLVWNNNYENFNSGGKRTPFNIAISKDEAKTWLKTKNIENDPNGWYCYTAIEFIDDYVLLAHCAGNRKIYGGLETTQITKLSLDWIYNEKTAEPYVVSNKNGEVKLDCEERGSKIYYTLDGSWPELIDKNIYIKSIKVNSPTPITMYATSSNKTISNLGSINAGEDIFFEANKELIIKSSGLEYEYYDGNYKNSNQFKKENITSTGITKSFTINKNKKKEFFAFNFEGIIQIEKDSQYTFYLTSNDGSVLFIDDIKIVDNDGLHSEYEKSTKISLRKGLHKIGLKYFQGGGVYSFSAKWSGAKIEKQEIPERVLFH